MREIPPVTFGLIVLNGEPFLRYNLRALYRFAHEIIVVEGAAPAAAEVATPEGHSRDGTLETLRRFRQEEDPESKVRIVTAEDEGHPNGFWPGEKHEQSQAYASRATGDYLWQVDVDEFYHPEDMEAVLHMLKVDTSITAVSFRTITFWGGFDYLTDGWHLKRGAAVYHRLFKWAKGYRYTTHRPPTVVDADGTDLRQKVWVRGEALARKGLFVHHYSLLFPRQVQEKCSYYAKAEWVDRSDALQWLEDCFARLNHPFRVHNVYTHPSWLEIFKGEHPPEIRAMRRDIESGKIKIAVRQSNDVEKLLRAPWYRLGRLGLRLLDYPDRVRIRGTQLAARGMRITVRLLRRMTESDRTFCS